MGALRAGVETAGTLKCSFLTSKAICQAEGRDASGSALPNRDAGDEWKVAVRWGRMACSSSSLGRRVRRCGVTAGEGATEEGTMREEGACCCWG